MRGDKKKKRAEDGTRRLLIERRCAFCGKVLYPTPQWVFKINKGKGILWFCKHSCKAAYEREHPTRIYTRRM